MRQIKKGWRLKGEEGMQFAADVVEAYKTASIRRICEETGRSYGAIHRLLSTSGATMRPRGYHRPATAASADAS
ncbi:helix-turn-helix domain-containing protein [Streptomyces sp. NPDC001165]|uniref:helix-turn-helix domain-containing protein n=1 Tax=Streptomyces sp. NPDC001165 TaxID=3364546 RepID=UPI0036C3B751